MYWNFCSCSSSHALIGAPTGGRFLMFVLFRWSVEPAREKDAATFTAKSARGTLDPHGTIVNVASFERNDAALVSRNRTMRRRVISIIAFGFLSTTASKAFLVNFTTSDSRIART